MMPLDAKEELRKLDEKRKNGTLTDYESMSCACLVAYTFNTLILIRKLAEAERTKSMVMFHEATTLEMDMTGDTVVCHAVLSRLWLLSEYEEYDEREGDGD
jgi:ADP-glucose pyrophosphorylase